MSVKKTTTTSMREPLNWPDLVGVVSAVLFVAVSSPFALQPVFVRLLIQVLFFGGAFGFWYATSGWALGFFLPDGKNAKGPTEDPVFGKMFFVGLCTGAILGAVGAVSLLLSAGLSAGVWIAGFFIVPASALELGFIFVGFGRLWFGISARLARPSGRAPAETIVSG